MTKEEADLRRVEAAGDAFSSERLRWLIGKGDVLTERGELTEEHLEELMDKTISEEINRNIILKELDDAPATITEISKATKMEKDFILENLLAMMKWNQVAIVGQKNSEYIYSKKAL